MSVVERNLEATNISKSVIYTFIMFVFPRKSNFLHFLFKHSFILVKVKETQVI